MFRSQRPYTVRTEPAEACTQAGNDNNALVIPVGLAFAKSVATIPDFNLYVPDLRHPSMAAATWPPA